MLIIFDLDDTLVDTSGSILPSKLQRSLQKMMAAGLKVDHEGEALESLKQLDFGAKSTEEALKEFLEILGAPPEILKIGLQEIYEDHELGSDVKATPHAHEILLDLCRKHTLCVVSVGREEIQLKKLKKAGIDTAFFSRIVVCENLDKKPSYEALMLDLKVLPHEVLVCGDRVFRDLTPAKQLGFKTIHYKWGRGLNHYGCKTDVDYVMTSLQEIKAILAQQEQDQTFTDWDCI